MKVAVTGATGMIGTAVVRALRERGDEVTAVSRSAERGDVAWADPKAHPAPAEALEGRDAVVHLLGEPIAQRWSATAKREIADSRRLGTRNLVEGLRSLERRPRVLVSQSAVGYYGPHADEPLTESAGPGSDFLAGVVSAWEAEAREAEALGLRVALMRTGVVLSQKGGALEKMLPPFKLGVGGPVAGGRQYVPWVHMDDVVGALLFALDNEGASGAINVTAPEPVTNKELSKALGRVLHRPALAPVPGLAVKALYGQMAEIVITGQRALPERLRTLGYEWRQPDLESALRDATGR